MVCLKIGEVKLRQLLQDYLWAEGGGGTRNSPQVRWQVLLGGRACTDSSILLIHVNLPFGVTAGVFLSCGVMSLPS